MNKACLKILQKGSGGAQLGLLVMNTLDLSIQIKRTTTLFCLIKLMLQEINLAKVLITNRPNCVQYKLKKREEGNTTTFLLYIHLIWLKVLPDWLDCPSSKRANKEQLSKNSFMPSRLLMVNAEFPDHKPCF